MSRITKFVENELDKINNYLAMAESALVVPGEICENSSVLNDAENKTEQNFLETLNPRLCMLELKIDEARIIIDEIKQSILENTHPL